MSGGYQRIGSLTALTITAGLILIAATTNPEIPLAPWETTYPTPKSTLIPAYPPNTLTFPNRGVSAVIVAIGKIPDDPTVVGVLPQAQTLAADQGTTIITGHVRTRWRLGFMSILSEIGDGEIMAITDTDEQTSLWQATSRKVYRKDNFPSWPLTGPRLIVLVTCVGPIMADGHYRDNLVIVFSPIARV